MNWYLLTYEHSTVISNYFIIDAKYYTKLKEQ